MLNCIISYVALLPSSDFTGKHHSLYKQWKNVISGFLSMAFIKTNIRLLLVKQMCFTKDIVSKGANTFNLTPVAFQEKANCLDDRAD